jgi:hypothetical protein
MHGNMHGFRERTYVSQTVRGSNVSHVSIAPVTITDIEHGRTTQLKYFPPWCLNQLCDALR